MIDPYDGHDIETCADCGAALTTANAHGFPLRFHVGCPGKKIRAAWREQEPQAVRSQLVGDFAVEPPVDISGYIGVDVDAAGREQDASIHAKIRRTMPALADAPERVTRFLMNVQRMLASSSSHDEAQRFAAEVAREASAVAMMNVEYNRARVRLAERMPPPLRILSRGVIITPDGPLNIARGETPDERGYLDGYPSMGSPPALAPERPWNVPGGAFVYCKVCHKTHAAEPGEEPCGGDGSWTREET